MGSTGAQIMKSEHKPYTKILEQPAPRPMRFRYECEGRSAGSILGANSTQDNKTYPAIQVCGFKGRAIVVVSCVTKDPPYRPHPYKLLVGKEGCRKAGVCTLEINPDKMIVSLNNLGIQCVKKNDIAESLKIRQTARIDPFGTGFSHRFHSSDLNVVRLCFQVILEGPEGKYTVQIEPVVSDPIFDKKAKSELIIYQLSDCSCTVNGGRKIILLCEKVVKENISVRFYEEQDGRAIWEEYGKFNHTSVHRQVAITFKTPSYKVLNIEKPVRVNIQLKRPSDGVTSDPLPFDFLPMDSLPEELKRKRQKLNGEARTYLLRHLDNHRLQNSANIGATGGFIDKCEIDLQQNISLKIPSPNGTDPYHHQHYHENLSSVPKLSSMLPVNNFCNNLPAYNITQSQKSINNNNPLKQTKLKDIPSTCNIVSNEFVNQVFHSQSLEMPSTLSSSTPATVNNSISSYNIPATGCINTFHQYPGNTFNGNGYFENVTPYNQQYTSTSSKVFNQTSMQHQYNNIPASSQNYIGSYDLNYSNLINMENNQQLAQYNVAEISRICNNSNYNTANSHIISQNIAGNVLNKVDEIEQEDMTDSFTRLSMNTELPYITN